jgi:carbon-monoxide dehydrogenase large subunit
MGYVGESVKRVEDPRFIQGQGKFVANLQLPGMAYAAIKRSPYAHAKIKKIDIEAARNLEGVIAVYTGKNLVEGTHFSAACGAMPCGWVPPDTKVPTHHALAVDKVYHVGIGVAAVVAESPYIARDALDLIEVEYEPLPSVVDAKAAAQEGAPQLYEEIANNTSFHWTLGTKEAAEAAFSEADHVVELDLINQRLIPNAIEPRAVVAQWNKFGEEMTVWTTSQNPHIIRLLLSGFTLGVPENKLRVISPDVGGGFGSKIFHYPEEVIVPWVARAINRPVKWVASRSESYVSDAQGRDHVTSCKLALKKDGTFTGLNVTTYANMGSYLSTFAPLIPTALYVTLFSGLYKIPAIWGEIWGTLTNTVPVDAYRGAGRPEASYLLERLVDLAAAELEMDVLEIRRKNFIPMDEFPYQTPVAMVYDSGNYAQLFDKAEQLADYKGMRKDQVEARKEGRLVGVGVGGCIEASAPGPSPVVTSLGSAIGLYESGVVRVHPTGNVSVFTGSHTHGQGHETTFAQVVADELGLPMEAVQIVHGDTDRIPFGTGTYGSRSAAIGGSALVRSAEKIREKVTRIAAHQLEAAYEDMVYDRENGTIYVKGSPDKSKTFAEIAFTTYYAANIPEGMEPGLEFTTYYDPSNFTFPNSAHIAQVEIDKDTGEVTIERYVAVDDVGKVINPMIVEGQIVGGIIQGVGQALWEYGQYDENGQLLSGSMMNYALPRADHFPKMEIARTETPSPHNPLGVKGAGEMGTIAATVTIANAVMDALSPLGIKHIDMPLTAEKIWQAIQSSQNGGSN